MRWLERRANWKPGFRSDAEPAPRHVTWLIEEFQPPIADDDPRHNLVEFDETPGREEWEGDSPADDDD